MIPLDLQILINSLILFGFFAFLLLLVIVYYLQSKTPFPLTSTLRKGDPVVIHNQGSLTVKFMKKGDKFLRPSKLSFIRLPTFESNNPHPKLNRLLAARSQWDGLKKNAWFMDARKRMALTTSMWSALSEAFRLKEEDRENISIYTAELMNPDDIIKATDSAFPPADTDSAFTEAYEIGRDEAGLNIGKVASILAIGIVGVMLIIVVYSLFLGGA